MRKVLLANNEIYHVLNKSIAKYKVFNNESDYLRMVNMLRYYTIQKPLMRFSQFNKLSSNEQKIFIIKNYTSNTQYLIDILSYNIMPTHIHLALKQLSDNGISNYVKNILISYSRYFNTKYKRKGPLWEGRFKNVHVNDEYQLLHLTRYIHLNAVSAGLVEKPEDWLASSYNEYISKVPKQDMICKFGGLINIKPEIYRKFVENRIAYQRQLSRIKKLILE
ncbi:MAG: hypothetical protein ACD_58C00132G0007 [uncultured bacterium]|nr:MAG: hypothetical protein ACD_58C00132G0007 [uncultured bacterium]